MCVDSTPASSCLAQWSWVIDGGPPDVAVVRDASQAVAHNWGLGVLAADVALIVAEFTSNAWTHGSVPITVTIRLQDDVLTIEVSDAGPGLTLFAGPRPLGAGGRGFPGAAAIAHVIGVEGGACVTKVWARLHFQWAPAETDPGAVSELTPRASGAFARSMRDSSPAIVLEQPGQIAGPSTRTSADLRLCA